MSKWAESYFIVTLCSLVIKSGVLEDSLTIINSIFWNSIEFIGFDRSTEFIIMAGNFTEWVFIVIRFLFYICWFLMSISFIISLIKEL